MKTLVAYYSRKGSNLFLAKRIAGELNCDMEAIRPRMNLFTFFLLGINTGIRKMKSPIADYERVIMVGPIFMGRFIPPLEAFLKRYGEDIRQLVFVTSCGSTYKQKDEKFGHGLVFKKVGEMMGEKLIDSQAFPIGLVMPEGQQDDQDAFMKTHLNEDNFKGEIVEIYQEFMKRIG